MSEEAARRVDYPVKKRGLIAKSIELILKIVGLVLFAALVSIVIEWIGMTFFYEEDGYEHAENMMKSEIGYLKNSLGEDNLNSEAVRYASDTVYGVSNFLFLDSGIIDSLNEAKAGNPTDNEFAKLGKGLLAEYYDYFMAAINILIMFMIRLSILILSLPAFILFGVVGACDGLMKRDLRRWCGGNESGYIYHWAKKFALPVLIAAWVIYLAIPMSVHPNLIITPFAVLFGLVLMVMTSKFKKYL